MPSGVAPGDGTPPHMKFWAMLWTPKDWSFVLCYPFLHGNWLQPNWIFFFSFLNPSPSRSCCRRGTSHTPLFLSIRQRCCRKSGLSHPVYTVQFTENSLPGYRRASSFNHFISETCYSLKLSKTDQLSKPPPGGFIQFPRTPTPFVPLDSSPIPNILENTVHGR